jgi:hypothetical protein
MCVRVNNGYRELDAKEFLELFKGVETQELEAGGGSLCACSISVDLDKGADLIKEWQLDVIRSGGVLFLKQVPAVYIPAPSSPKGVLGNGYRLAPSATLAARLYWIVRCTFANSLDLIDQFSFYAERLKSTSEIDIEITRKWADAAERSRKIEEVKKLLRWISEKQEIAITDYNELGLAVRQLGKDSGLWSEYVKEALKFNCEVLGVEYSRSEYRGYIEQFAKFRFFDIRAKS